MSITILPQPIKSDDSGFSLRSSFAQLQLDSVIGKSLHAAGIKYDAARLCEIVAKRSLNMALGIRGGRLHLPCNSVDDVVGRHGVTLLPAADELDGVVPQVETLGGFELVGPEVDARGDDEFSFTRIFGIRVLRWV